MAPAAPVTKIRTWAMFAHYVGGRDLVNAGSMTSRNRGSLRRILVTGATGRLGRHVCRALAARGHEVRATDRRFFPDLPGGVTVGDLRDEAFVYSVLEGCDGLVHLGNHPHAGAGPSRSGVLSENTAMNANVMYAAADLGVRTIVFASSIQAMIRGAGTRGLGPFTLPYLPLDGTSPADPGMNPYALSKEYGERLLRVLADGDAEISVTALRFPMLPDETWLEHIARGVSRTGLNWSDGLTYLPMEDAAQLTALVLERSRPGYSQLLPATSFAVRGQGLAEIVAEHYPTTHLRRPIEELQGLVDEGFAAEFGLKLRPRVSAVFID